jgi:hypothetical protein
MICEQPAGVFVSILYKYPGMTIRQPLALLTLSRAVHEHTMRFGFVKGKYKKSRTAEKVVFRKKHQSKRKKN